MSSIDFYSDRHWITHIGADSKFPQCLRTGRSSGQVWMPFEKDGNDEELSWRFPEEYVTRGRSVRVRYKRMLKDSNGGKEHIGYKWWLGKIEFCVKAETPNGEDMWGIQFGDEKMITMVNLRKVAFCVLISDKVVTPEEKIKNRKKREKLKKKQNKKKKKEQVVAKEKKDREQKVRRVKDQLETARRHNKKELDKWRTELKKSTSDLPVSNDKESADGTVSAGDDGHVECDRDDSQSVKTHNRQILCEPTRGHTHDEFYARFHELRKCGLSCKDAMSIAKNELLPEQDLGECDEFFSADDAAVDSDGDESVGDDGNESAAEVDECHETDDDCESKEDDDCESQPVKDGKSSIPVVELNDHKLRKKLRRLQQKANLKKNPAAGKIHRTKHPTTTIPLSAFCK